MKENYEKEINNLKELKIVDKEIKKVNIKFNNDKKAYSQMDPTKQKFGKNNFHIINDNLAAADVYSSEAERLEGRNTKRLILKVDKNSGETQIIGYTDDHYKQVSKVGENSKYELSSKEHVGISILEVRDNQEKILNQNLHNKTEILRKMVQDLKIEKNQIQDLGNAYLIQDNNKIKQIEKQILEKGIQKENLKKICELCKDIIKLQKQIEQQYETKIEISPCNQQ